MNCMSLERLVHFIDSLNAKATGSRSSNRLLCLCLQPTGCPSCHPARPHCLDGILSTPSMPASPPSSGDNAISLSSPPSTPPFEDFYTDTEPHYWEPAEYDDPGWRSQPNPPTFQDLYDWWSRIVFAHLISAPDFQRAYRLPLSAQINKRHELHQLIHQFKIDLDTLSLRSTLRRTTLRFLIEFEMLSRFFVIRYEDNLTDVELAEVTLDLPPPSTHGVSSFPSPPAGFHLPPPLILSPQEGHQKFHATLNTLCAIRAEANELHQSSSLPQCRRVLHQHLQQLIDDIVYFL
ncbi:hypothetical protein CALVIDRAFT_365243 [Calocera viscosa TUFC12733]|uniref:Uncharacterized protein n=1 Tax=Calocera viscosa (strain TUFC12733) TaxID=1330018 RepID=A0A167H2H7_CALVF|nr:hypothetical protein CALVIDRAFT_365243 [Calocera viscosa TUFC12733]